MSPIIPPTQDHLTYLSLAELLDLEDQFAHQGAKVVGYGDDWVIRVKPDGKGEQTFRAHKAVKA